MTCYSKTAIHLRHKSQSVIIDNWSKTVGEGDENKSGQKRRSKEERNDFNEEIR